MGLHTLASLFEIPDQSLAFYQKVFGVQVYYRDEDSIQVLGPGSFDVIAFDRDAANAGKSGGIAHFGFRLVEPGDIDSAVAEVKRAGGKLIRRGEFAPGLPFRVCA